MGQLLYSPVVSQKKTQLESDGNTLNISSLVGLCGTCLYSKGSIESKPLMLAWLLVTVGHNFKSFRSRFIISAAGVNTHRMRRKAGFRTVPEAKLESRKLDWTGLSVTKRLSEYKDPYLTHSSDIFNMRGLRQILKQFSLLHLSNWMIIHNS